MYATKVKHLSDKLQQVCKKNTWSIESRNLIYSEIFYPAYNDLSRRGLKSEYWKEVSYTIRQEYKSFAPSPDLVKGYCSSFHRIKRSNAEVIITVMLYTLSEYLQRFHDYFDESIPEKISQLHFFINNSKKQENEQ
jgi:hypothetical protein